MVWRRIRLEERVALLGKMRNAYTIMVGKIEETTHTT
jgi:hypothetical protein